MIVLASRPDIAALSCFVILAIVCVQKCVTLDQQSKGVNLKDIQNKPIGVGLPQLKVDEVASFPDARHFFEKYVRPQKPLVIRGGAKISPAFHKWTDEYFLSLDIPADHTIDAERGKKEDRSGNMVTLHFKEFLRQYNSSDIYMVNPAPDFLRADLVVPCPLRCPGVTFAETMVWFSSGGTSSVLHTDAFDNLNCVYRGSKRLLLIDRDFSMYYHIDKLDGAYSTVDVDAVDYEKYPGLAKVEYYNVSMEAGDCLFIPHLTAHQVRSFGSNLAINIWWNTEVVDLQRCDAECGESLRLSHAHHAGIYGHTDLDFFRQILYSLIKEGESEIIEELVDKILQHPTIAPMLPEEILVEGAPVLQSALERLDVNNDDSLSFSEIHESEESNWEKIIMILEKLKEFQQQQHEMSQKKSKECQKTSKKSKKTGKKTKKTSKKSQKTSASKKPKTEL